MRPTFRLAALAAALTLLAACGQQDAPAPAADAPAVPAEAPAIEAATPSTTEDGWNFAGAADAAPGILTVTPNPADFCTAERTAVDVSWDVSSLGTTHLQLWLVSAGGERKLWVAPSTRSGSKPTGAWLEAGARVVALDASTSTVLAFVEIAAAPCGPDA